MKIAAMILGILGGVAAAGLGAKWVSDYNKHAEQIASLSKAASEMGAESDAMAEVKKIRNAGYALLVLGLVAIVGAGLIGKLGGKVAGGIMVAAAVIPAIFAPKSLIFTFLLIIGGVLAFLLKDDGGSAPSEG